MSLMEMKDNDVIKFDLDIMKMCIDMMRRIYTHTKIEMNYKLCCKILYNIYDNVENVKKI